MPWRDDHSFWMDLFISCQSSREPAANPITAQTTHWSKEKWENSWIRIPKRGKHTQKGVIKDFVGGRALDNSDAIQEKTFKKEKEGIREVANSWSNHYTPGSTN